MDRRSFLKKAGLGMAAASAAALDAPAVLASGKIKWRMVTSWPPGMPILQTAAENFAKWVGEMSGGRLTIQVFAGGELVPPLGVFDAVSRGMVQCGHSASYYWAGKAKACQWFTSVPFGLNAQGMNAWLYKGNGLKLWEEVAAEFNIVPRPAGNTGVQMGGWFNREIKSLSDFKGLKMRIPGLGGKVLSRAGGTVVLLPAGEIYTSLERGVLDATEWAGPAHDLRMGFQKVAKYYYGPGWHEPGSVLELSINKKAYDALPSDLKAVVDAAAARANVEMLSEFEAENGKAMQQVLAMKSVQVRTFPKEVLQGLKKLAEETVAAEAESDSVAMKVNRDFQEFKKRAGEWAQFSERPYYELIA